jgi:hypothetical protein
MLGSRRSPVMYTKPNVVSTANRMTSQAFFI